MKELYLFIDLEKLIIMNPHHLLKYYFSFLIIKNYL